MFESFPILATIINIKSIYVVTFSVLIIISVTRGRFLILHKVFKRQTNNTQQMHYTVSNMTFSWVFSLTAWSLLFFSCLSNLRGTGGMVNSQTTESLKG